MSKPNFVYVTYINTTTEKLWNALIDPAQNKLYWFDHRNVSDWKVGSTWEHLNDDHEGRVDVVGKVLESNPPRKLVVSWAAPAEAGDAAKTSRVTYDIELVKGTARLMVTHEDLEPESKMLKSISMGWPMVLSSLKTFLETGKPMPQGDSTCESSKK